MGLATRAVGEDERRRRMSGASKIEWTDAKLRKRAYDRARYVRRRDAARALQAPDPITLLSDTEAAYLAGLIDGEGSLYVGAVGPKRNRTCYPILDRKSVV